MGVSGESSVSRAWQRTPRQLWLPGHYTNLPRCTPGAQVARVSAEGCVVSGL
jgi:hypothetical protein